MQATVEATENKWSYLMQRVEDLESELLKIPSKESIENMRQELQILKKLEYYALDVDPETEAPWMTSRNINDDTNDLEAVLTNKLQKIRKDLVREQMEEVKRKVVFTPPMMVVCCDHQGIVVVTLPFGVSIFQTTPVKLEKRKGENWS